MSSCKKETAKGSPRQAKNNIGSSSMPSSTCKTAAQPTNETNGNEVDLHTQLWLACAGALAKIPRDGDKIFYFPQGHIEQVEACVNQDCNFEMPLYNLPSKILCTVVHVQLEAETNTDEVFAKIDLLPEGDEISCVDSTSISKPQKVHSNIFSKRLTPSDTSTHGGFSVPKRHADECFPPLNMAQEPPAQELVAKDLNGTAWYFRHIFRGHPRRNMLTTGWSLFVTSKKLAAGDTIIFLGGKNGELRIGVRRATRSQNRLPASVISSLSMQHGILATAFHAKSTGSRFTVYYRPWMNPVEFLVPYDQYVKSEEISYQSGMRFRMQLEVEDTEYRCTKFSGTVTGIEDIDRIRWPDSEWRRLKVKWDARSSGHVLPERVSPWCIEPVRSKKKLFSPFTSNPKRPCPSDPLASESPFEVEQSAGKPSKVLQGQEAGASENPLNRVLTNFCAPEFPSYPKTDKIHDHSDSLDANLIGSASDDSKTSAETNTSPKCMLFGIDIVNGIPHPKETIHVADASKCVSPDPPEQQCQNCSPICNRSCTKVLKYGAAVGRSVDLAGFSGYKELISELDKMFDFEGTLIAGSNEWHVTYRDDEGDMMLLGDCPWPEFKAMVRKMFICPKEDGENANRSSGN